MAERGPLLALGGPTASGKTELAIDLALRLGGEIVNADSRQVYRGMDIGTAKPTPAQRATVPHHLLDVVTPAESFTLALFAQRAHAVIRDIQERGRLPILVGGTGLYLRAVTQGYIVPEVPPDAALRRDLEREAAAHGPETLAARLRAVDPEGAARIDVRNVRRLIRALEVTQHLGVPFSQLQRQDPPYRSLVVTLTGPHEMLYSRADARLDAMIAGGFIDEVADLLAAGYGSDLPAMSALGYRELGRLALGEATLDEARAATRASTRAFIRRQLTWFRSERSAVPLAIEEPALPALALELVQRALLAVSR